MATSKQYAYYLEGNQIAIVEKDVSFDNDVDSKDYGPGASRQRWESPQSSVTNGLEIKYSYAPTYRLNTDFTLDLDTVDANTYSSGTDVVKFNAWGSDGENLLLFATDVSGVSSRDLSGIYAADDWIYVSGSSRWSGLHQVKSVPGDDMAPLILKTRHNQTLSVIEATIDIAANNQLDGDNTDDRTMLNLWYSNGAPTTIWIGPGLTSYHHKGGLIDCAWINGYTIDLQTRHILSTYGDYTTEDVNFTATVMANASPPIYNVTREEFLVYEKVDVMQDESFELDLPLYLQKALVYYIRAKLAEDGGNLKLREYAMREFKKIIEKHENSRISGLRIISPGSHSIR